MLARGSIPGQAAPRISGQAIFGFEKPGANRVQVNVITNRSEIAVAAAIHQRRFVPSTEDMAREFVAAVQAIGVDWRV